MSKKYFLGFNWKLNPTSHLEAKNLLKSYKEILSKNPTESQVVAFPPSLYLYPLQVFKQEENLNLELGSQDVSSNENGAFTAEISAKQLTDIDLKWTLIGHSETRELRKLSNSDVNEKVLTAVKNGLSVVLCIGYQKDKNQTEINFLELKEQLLDGLRDVFTNLSGEQKIVIAYEPVWAIGSGKTASKEIVTEVIDFLVQEMESNFPEEDLAKIHFLYGGSVNETSILEFLDVPGLDGFLIGGASLAAEKVEGIIKALKN